MPELNASIRDIPLPARLKGRPISERGFPVPWFVSFIGGKWDFVNLDRRKIGEAHKRKLCWLCGQPLGQFMCFPIGPMCSINRISSEPPAHRDCAEYAVRACPFLARPSARRNEAAQVAGSIAGPGVPLEHNPGAVLIWITKHYSLMQLDNGVLFQLGEPIEVAWYCEGRAATRAEIEAAIAKGLPLLRKAAESDGPGGLAELEQYIKRAERLLPAA
jgi:hypothetical protein